jgi:hypothetical protein
MLALRLRHVAQLKLGLDPVRELLLQRLIECPASSRNALDDDTSGKGVMGG